MFSIRAEHVACGWIIGTGPGKKLDGFDRVEDGRIANVI